MGERRWYFTVHERDDAQHYVEYYFKFETCDEEVRERN
jgi:hypothetical protein